MADGCSRIGERIQSGNGTCSPRQILAFGSLFCGVKENTMGTSVNHPYFSPDELAFLCERQRGGKMSETQEGKARVQGCLFIEAVSSRIGL